MSRRDPSTDPRRLYEAPAGEHIRVEAGPRQQQSSGQARETRATEPRGGSR